MPKKYYAVAVGHQTGIFEDWPTCQKQTNGYSGAIYKSFKTRQEAENYLQQFAKPTNITYDYQIYTDGSFKDGLMGYGYVMINQQEQEITRGYGPIKSISSARDSNNVAEITAISKALEFVYSHSNRPLEVLIKTDSNYAYQQISMLKAKCLELGWQIWEQQFKNIPNFDLLTIAIWYIFNLQAKQINIYFEHVSAHCGITFNEIADRLADEGRYKD